MKKPTLRKAAHTATGVATGVAGVGLLGWGAYALGAAVVATGPVGWTIGGVALGCYALNKMEKNGWDDDTQTDQEGSQ